MKITQWLLALLIALPVFADAQSVPNGGAIAPGQVWTPQQWMNAWQSKLDTTSSGGIFNNPTIVGGTLNSPSINGATSTNGIFNNPTINSGTLSGDVSTSTAIASDSTTAISLASRFSQIFNVRDYGAKGDDSHDDSIAIAAAENAALALPNGSRPTVYFPAGSYLLGSGAVLPVINRPVSIIGDGTHKSYLHVSTAYGGDVIAFDEVWGNNLYANGMPPANDYTGPVVKDIAILGNTTAPATQNAIMFYDRNTRGLVQNVFVNFLNGKCLGFGTTKNIIQAWTIETDIVNVQCFDVGPPSGAAVDVSSTSSSGSDATNEIKFINLDVFRPPDVGFQVRNPNNFSATRLIDCVNCRIEAAGGNSVEIGSSSDAGQVNDIHFVNLQTISPGYNINAGKYGLKIDTAGQQIYDVFVSGITIGPCFSGISCNALYIGNVRNANIGVSLASVSGTTVTYGPTVGVSVILHGANNENGWTYSIDSAAVSKVTVPIYKYGNPTGTTGATNAPSVGMAYHDGTSSFGNSMGAGAVDLMSLKTASTNVPSGNGSSLVGGTANSILNNAAQAGIYAGNNNTVSASQSFIGGGLQATDRSRPSQCYAGGQLTVQGDAQACRFVLSATCASCSSQRLTSGHGAASAINIANISNSQSYAMSWRCVARDTTTGGTDNATVMPVMLMTRDGGGVSTTAVALGTPATATRGTWTGGGFAFSADTTNGGINIAFTSPTGNTDTFHAVCEGHDAETQ